MPNYATPGSAVTPPGGVTAPGGVPTGLSSDEMRRWYLNQDPTAGFYAFLNAHGLGGGTTPQERYAQGQQNTYFNNYLAQSAGDPTLGFYDYLQQNNPDIGANYMNQSPTARGDFSSRTYVPRGRWVNA